MDRLLLRRYSRITTTWTSATWTIAIRQLPPRTIATQDNFHPESCRLGQLPPRKLTTHEAAIRKTATQEKWHPDNCHQGRSPPRAIATQDNCHPDNYHPDNCHLGNCYLVQLPPKATANYCRAIATCDTTTLGILSSLSLLPFKATPTSQFSGILHKQSFSSSDHLDSLRTLTFTLKLLSREFRVDVVTSSKGFLSQWKINSFWIFSNFSQQNLLCTLSHRIHSTHS